MPNHPNSHYVNSHSPEGISPVFFIEPAGFGGSSHYLIAERLWSNPAVSSLCDLGQSFGFDRTRIWPDDNITVIRVSGGIYSEKEQAELDKAFGLEISNICGILGGEGR